MRASPQSWLHTCDACVITTWRLGLRAPLVARNNKKHSRKSAVKQYWAQISLVKNSNWQWPFFNGQCRLANSNTFLAKVLRVKFSFSWQWCESREDKIKWQRLVSAGHVILQNLPLIGHNLLLVYYQFEYKGNFYKYGLYYTWVQMLLQIGPLLRLGSKCYYGWDFYYAWIQMLLRMGPLWHLGPVIRLVPSTT